MVYCNISRFLVHIVENQNSKIWLFKSLGIVDTYISVTCNKEVTRVIEINNMYAAS